MSDDNNNGNGDGGCAGVFAHVGQRFLDGA